MSPPRTALERVIRRVRGDANYAIDSRITAGELTIELADRGISLIRSLWKLAGVRGGIVRFVEPGVSIRHRRHLSVGTGSVLEAGTRLSCLSTDGIVIGRGVTVGRGVIVECTSVLWHKGVGFSIGDRSSIGEYSFVGCAGGVAIGENVLIGQRVSFHSQNHNFERTGELIRDQGVREDGIRVGDDCWIGSGAIILDGVVLGEGSVVGAGSVVSRSFPARSVIAGVPARVVKSREAA
jgi:acetyltransferase-like isoleucine patch superfamily enzyme